MEFITAYIFFCLVIFLVVVVLLRKKIANDLKYIFEITLKYLDSKSKQYLKKHTKKTSSFFDSCINKLQEPNFDFDILSKYVVPLFGFIITIYVGYSVLNSTQEALKTNSEYNASSITQFASSLNASYDWIFVIGLLIIPIFIFGLFRTRRGEFL